MKPIPFDALSGNVNSQLRAARELLDVLRILKELESQPDPDLDQRISESVRRVHTTTLNMIDNAENLRKLLNSLL